MILEERVKEVSNRYFPETDKSDFYPAEIKDAVEMVSDQGIASKTEANECLPEELDNLKDLKDLKDLDDIKEIFFLLEGQNTAGVNYNGLFSYLENKPSLPKEDYQQETEKEAPEQDTSLMSDEEAEKTVQKIQLSYLIGDKENISYEEKEKFHRWQEFNKVLLMLYHHLSPVCTGDVDYSRLN